MSADTAQALTVISVCTATDIHVWRHTAASLLKNIQASRYLVFVPGRYVTDFVNSTPTGIEVVDENTVISADTSERLRCELSRAGLGDRLGWYLQQFIKLGAAKVYGANGDVLIWDADTVPLKQIKFIDEERRVALFSSSEYHPPYFATISRLLGLQKVFPRSFIAQCLYLRSAWIDSFFLEIEARNNCCWEEALFASIDFGEKASFSEYETLGTFVTSKYSEAAFSLRRGWCRRGGMIFSSPERLRRIAKLTALLPLNFVSFERWDTRQIMANVVRNYAKRRIQQIRTRLRRTFGLDKGNDTVKRFLAEFFSSDVEKLVVQIGANDGIQNDFLRQYLAFKGAYKCILIEPIPFYVEKLRRLYRGRDDIAIVACALGETRSTAKLYYIPPATADKMHGDGPVNQWAHGQGSFFRENVAYWIKKNSFRGKTYRDNIPSYIAEIATIDVQICRGEDLIPPTSNTLIVIDVQGAELVVLKGLDWSNAPRHIIIEDDLGHTRELTDFLVDKGYVYVGGNSDKLFSKAP